MIRITMRGLIAGAGVALVVFYAGAAGLTLSPALDAPAVAQTDGRVPGGALGTVNDAELWRQVRQGEQGTVSLPNKQAGVLVQSEGDNWMNWRNGPIALVGAIMFWLMFFVVFGFYMIRGKVRIAHGPSGRKVLRFTTLERFAHWLTAVSFLVLAVTGVNMLYGKHIVMPIVGKAAFAALTQAGKYVHNYIAFAFMAGLLLIFVLWVKDNIWDRYDAGWIKKGGGLLFETEHPPAAKFNFGQKTMFWAVILGGGVLSFTGLNLLFPFVLFDLQQMQWIQAIHGTVSQILCMLMVAHIYIGTVGMEGALQTMTTGKVDENWAREHHSAWLKEVREKEAKARAETPGVAPGAPAE